MTRKAEEIYYELVARAKQAIENRPKEITISKIRLQLDMSDNCLKDVTTMYINNRQSAGVDEVIANSILELKKMKREA